MAGQSGEGETDPVSIEGDTAAWVRDRAAETDLGPGAYLERVIAAVRAVEDGETPATASDLSELADRVEDLDEELDEKIDDVRNRVIQVKREVDQKAPTDHDHEDLDATVDRLEDRLDRGFENYEEILRYLVDETDDLAEDAASLSDAVEALGQAHRAIRAREERRRRTEAIKRAANRAGITAAKCGECGSEVQVALLTDPECPFCGADVADVTGNPGFFGSATLETGAPPALEDPAESEVADLNDVGTRDGDRSEDRPNIPEEGETTIDVGDPGAVPEADRRGEADE